MTSTIRVATDVGGTFTDLVYFETDDETGRQSIRTAKVHTTPPNFEEGVLNVLAKGKVDVSAVAFFAHGTTVVINALTERKGVKTALITTEGFRDVLEIARGNRPDFFNLMYEKPKPFVPRRLRREAPGRMNYRGEETAPLNLAGLPAILDDFRAEGVEAIAICLLHAYANPAHEQALAAEVRRLMPEVAVVASHQITREWREYERTNTTVLSAYVQPIAESYLDRLERGLKANGNRGQLYIMQSNCGVDLLAATKAIPITMVESGPASGLLGRSRARPHHRRAQRSGARHRRHDRQVLADRGRSCQDHDRLLDRAEPALVRLSRYGSGRRRRRDRQRRRLDRLGRRLRQAACRTAIGGRDSRPRGLWPGRRRGDDDRRQYRAWPHQQGLFLRRRDQGRHARRRSRARARRREARRQRRSRRRAASCASPTTT